MRRRKFLASLGGGVTVASSGCLGSEVVHDVTRSVRIDPNDGWWWEVENIGGSAEVGYTVRSEVHTFQVFYFTDPGEFQQYQTYVAGQEPERQPRGHDGLRMTAVPDADGIYEAQRPIDGARLDIDIENTHYFVVDYSNYDQNLDVQHYDDTLVASVDLTVVDAGIGPF